MSVKVAVRCRPLNLGEHDDEENVIVRMDNNEVEVMNCLEGYGGRFYFDSALWSVGAQVDGNKNQHASQDVVYNSVALELVNHFMTGYNGCIFAYGQTGSGKTYSMIGTPTDIGIIPRVASDIFVEMGNLAKSGVQTCVEASYFEIYNEKVRCLLCPNNNDFERSALRVREHPKFGPFIEGLTKFVVLTEEELLRLLNEGNKVRTAGATAMNALSSRSHAVFAISLTQKWKKGPVLTTKTSKLNLVDLAGSERMSKTLTTGKRLTEGVNINKSLTCLGNVISNLAEEQESGKSRHIPYRDSVLTWILKDNLGGNSKTVMLATISPSSLQYDETMSTLRYAERAKKIVNKAVVNESNNNELIAALQKEIEQLKSKLLSATDNERDKLVDQLMTSEAFHHELQMSLEEKLEESRHMMEEREKYMLHLEEQLEAQRGEIANLRQDNAEKERRIEMLLEHIKEVQKRVGNGESTEVDQLLEELANLESEEQVEQVNFMPSNKIASSRTANDTMIRQENIDNMPSQQTEGGRISVRALVKIFESVGTEQPVVKRTVPLDSVPCHDSVIHRVEIFEKKTKGKNVPPSTGTASVDVATLSDELLEGLLGNDEKGNGQKLEQEKQEGSSAGKISDYDDGDVDLDLMADEEDSGILLTDAMDLDLMADEEESGLQLEEDMGVDPDLSLEDDVDESVLEELEFVFDDDNNDINNSKNDNDNDNDNGVNNNNYNENDVTNNDNNKSNIVGDAWVPSEIQEDMSLEDYKRAFVALKNDESDNEGEDEDAKNSGTTHHYGQASTTGDITESGIAGTKAALTTAADTMDVTKTAPASASSGILSPFPAVITLVVPSHALPNNRYLHELFKVIKKSDGVLLGNKKDRIWVVDFFKRRFSNLDMTGYVSFEYSAGHLLRVEKDPVNSRCLTLYFFGAPHPYELEFTSTSRRQQFYELAMTLRRHSIMWCPSLCLESEKDTILNVIGTTIDHPNAGVKKVGGETKFMVARMPYEVVDVWYGCFSLKDHPLPRSTAVLGSFLPRESHEVYVIGVLDVPQSYFCNEDLCNYFLEHLGSSLHHVIANTTIPLKRGHANNAFIVIVRRSFVFKTSHVEAMETTPVFSENIPKGEFTAVGCSLRINETSIGIILVNAKPIHCSVSWRAAALRMIISSFPFGDTSVDIGARFDYFIVSGAFNFGADFKPDDVLLAQIGASNIMSNMVEATPTAAVVNAAEPIRIFCTARPHICRLDVKRYTASRALSMPNAFVSMDVFSQRTFLNVFGDQVPRVQLVLDDLVVSSSNHRIPPISSSQLRISAEWIADSPLLTKMSNEKHTYSVSGRAVPMVIPTVSNTDFLRLQSITFSLLGVMNKTQKKHASVVASGVLPLKNAFKLGEFVSFSIPVYYRACCIGTLTGKLLLAAYERNTADLVGFESERDVLMVSCYENQILDDKCWVPTVFSQHHAYSFSQKDVTVERTRESYTLPDPTKWTWLNLWRHDVLPNDVEGWTYSEGFDQPFYSGKFNKSNKSSTVRRRRWTRLMQASDPIAYHNYVIMMRYGEPLS